MSIVQSIVLLLAAAHLLGWLATRLRLPDLLGPIAAGVLLGPAVLAWVTPGPGLSAVSDLALLLVVVTSGLELRLESLLQIYGRGGVLRLLPGFLLPAAAGWLLARGWNLDGRSTTVVMLSLAITALPVALRILKSFGLMGTRLAHIAIGDALLADVVVLIVLGIEPAIAAGGSVAALAGVAALRLGALLLLVCGAAWLCRLAALGTHDTWRTSAAQPLAALLLILALAGASDALHLHFAIGAFLGALTVSHYGVGGTRHALHGRLEASTELLFAPLFLATQGLQMIAFDPANVLFTLALTVVAIAAKLVGGYWTARCYGLRGHEARGVAIMVNARGVMAMVAASIAYRSGLIGAQLYSALVTMGVVATAVTLLLLRRWQSTTPAVAATGKSSP